MPKLNKMGMMEPVAEETSILFEERPKINVITRPKSLGTGSQGLRTRKIIHLSDRLE